MNSWDFVIVALLALAVGLAVRRIGKNRKSGCSCGCAHCQSPCGKAKQDEMSTQ